MTLTHASRSSTVVVPSVTANVAGARWRTSGSLINAPSVTVSDVCRPGTSSSAWRAIACSSCSTCRSEWSGLRRPVTISH